MSWQPELPATAADIAKYEKLLPGFTQRLVEMAEREQKYRYRTILIGQLSALAIALSFLVASVYLIAGGHEVAGTILGTVDIVALVVAFMTGSGSPARGNVEPQALVPPDPGPA